MNGGEAPFQCGQLNVLTLQELYEAVKARDPDQNEFLQAVEEVCFAKPITLDQRSTVLS